MTAICTNLNQVLENIAAAARKAGRAPETVKLVAVSKTVPVGPIQEAIDCGQVLFGENYLQEAAEKIPQLRGASWHYIGHLQSNKCREIATLFDTVETVDRLKVAYRLDEQAAALNRQLKILVQVNIGEEPQKAGVMPDETEALLAAVRNCAHLRCLGLMALPPHFDDPEGSRPYFRQVREIGETCARKELFFDNQNLELSMGMSGDYPAAIEEGATIIRVGTALFGSRPGKIKEGEK